MQNSTKRTLNRLLKISLFFLFILTAAQEINAQIYTWTGEVSSNFSDSLNWSPNTWIPLKPTGAETVMIGAGSTNNPIFYKGSSTLRYGRFNTKGTANFISRGTIYAWNSDSINGIINLDSYSEFNSRNNCYIGYGNTGVVTLKGVLSTKYDVYVGYGAKGAGTLNINGGTVYVGRSLYIAASGATGLINITGVGALNIPGNVTSTMQTLINAGKIITTDAGMQLEAVYSNSTTTVQVKRTMTGMLMEYSSYVILDNGIVKAKIEKSSGKVLSLLFNGVEMIAQSGGHVTAYYDWTDGTNFESLSHCVFSVTQQNDSLVDISFKDNYTPEMGDVIGGDMDVHFVIKKNLTGLYTYSVLEHQPSYPAVGLGSWRLVYSLGHDASTYVCEKIYVDSLRHWQMPGVTDTYETTPIQEIVKMTSGARAGHFDGKYEYVTDLWNIGTWGFASDVNKLGTWMVFGSHEFFNEGPTYHDLNAAAGIIHVCLNGLHYNLKSFTVAQGEHWRKIYGPFLIYFNQKNTGDESWVDAQQRAKQEEKEWPYSWLTNNPEYPLANQRGAISGSFKVSDAFKPEVTGANAWIGVTQISNGDNQWQQEGKNYKYWIKTDSTGNFTIPEIRPGTYSLFAYTNGEVGEFSKTNVTVTAGDTTSMGDLVWTIARNKGKIAWEIGYPNRSASEFGHGHTDFFEGYVYDNFYKEYSNPLEYNVDEKNWDTALPYAHSVYEDAAKNLSSWKWRLHFKLPSNIATSGNATLTIAYAGNDHAQQWIYVNNENSTFSAFYPPNGGGNGLLRQTNHAMYGISTITIPMSKLVKGDNIITLLNPSSSSMVNHLMYDYLSLEVPMYDCMGVLNGTAFVDSCSECAGGTSGVTPVLSKENCTSAVTAVNELIPPEVFPNPFNNSFVLSCVGKVSYSIISLTGETIEKGSSDKKINLGSGLKPGVYILKLNQDQNLKCFKIIKN
ncbi:MAG: polysaccharide lyase family protein [Paludibacter sp.]|nr:polysaccharide lyase family protein [Paludibacter sp.]